MEMTIPTGRDLDAVIAEKVMGWIRPTRQYQPWDTNPTLHPGCCLCSQSRLPRFSEDMGAAWMVVEKMGERGFHLTLIDAQMWEAQFFERHPGPIAGKAMTPAAAICLAALGVIEGWVTP